MLIERITSASLFTDDDLKALGSLLSQLTGKDHAVWRARIDLAAQASEVLICLVEGRIVGTATLVTVEGLLRRKGLVEDVVVDAAHRGAGIGRALMREIVDAAKIKRLEVLELTSSPSRVAANRLYRDLGFSRRDTNVYRLEI